MINKPSYTTTKRQMRVSFWLAWAVIIALAVGALAGKPLAVDFASIAVPSMVVLIVGLLGVHRFSGAMDMATMAASRSATFSSTRDSPVDAAFSPVGSEQR